MMNRQNCEFGGSFGEIQSIKPSPKKEYSEQEAISISSPGNLMFETFNHPIEENISETDISGDDPFA